jgi:hypothetical protein
MAWTAPRTWTTGEVVTAAIMNTHVRDNLAFLKEIAYVEFTANVTVNATTAATANLVVSSGAITYEAAPIVVEFYSPGIEPDVGAVGRQVIIGLCDNGAGTNLGRLGQVRTPVAGNSLIEPVRLEREFTPSAATHTYEIRAYVTAGSGTVLAGVGGSDVAFPGFVRIRGVPR